MSRRMVALCVLLAPFSVGCGNDTELEVRVPPPDTSQMQSVQGFANSLGKPDGLPPPVTSVEDLPLPKAEP